MNLIRTIQEQSTKVTKLLKNNRVPTGCAAYTGAGDMEDIKYVIHAVGPIYSGYSKTQNEIEMVKTVWSCLKLGFYLKCKTISIPAVSSGIFGFPKPKCARLMILGTYYYYSVLFPSELGNYSAINFTNIDYMTFSKFQEKNAMIEKKLNSTECIKPNTLKILESAKDQFNNCDFLYLLKEGKWSESVLHMDKVFEMYKHENKYFAKLLKQDITVEVKMNKVEEVKLGPTATTNKNAEEIKQEPIPMVTTNIEEIKQALVPPHADAKSQLKIDTTKKAEEKKEIIQLEKNIEQASIQEIVPNKINKESNIFHVSNDTHNLPNSIPNTQAQSIDSTDVLIKKAVNDKLTDIVDKVSSKDSNNDTKK